LIVKREIILDTETTGLSPLEGHRIVEIGAIELLNHLPTGKTFHVYFNPERDMPKEAEAIHGLSMAFLRDKPKFKEKMQDFLEFIADDVLIIHNASFDMGFLNSELAYCEVTAIAPDRVIDTLMLARKSHPMGPNSLDALCRRYGIDNSRRTKHGALLDAELLAEVYLHLIGGRQTVLGLQTSTPMIKPIVSSGRSSPLLRAEDLPSRLTAAELDAHTLAICALGESALWKQ
jgi:DNA polymerase-3 subunit epsilon